YTNTWPLEFVATATDSPRYSQGGGFRKLGTEVKGISGTFCAVAFNCAAAPPAHKTKAKAHVVVRCRFIRPSQIAGFNWRISPHANVPGRYTNRRGASIGPA